jgi:NitT/TauT family transport system substrate-binding protein
MRNSRSFAHTRPASLAQDEGKCRSSLVARPLTLTLSPLSRGEGTVLAIALLLLFSCGRHEAPVSAAKVRLNVNPTLTYAPIMIAKDEGFFAAEGVDAEFVSLDSNSALAAAVAGRIDVLSCGIRSGVFNMMIKGVPLQIVADKGHSDPSAGCSPDSFIAPIETAKRIEAAGGSLRGERIALIRGGLVDYLTMRLLQRRGQTPRDVVILQMPNGTAASSRDKLDGVRLTTEPNLSSALSEGWARVVASADEVAPGHQNSILVYGKRLLRDDPDLGRRFMRAYLRGVRRYAEGKTERNVAIISRYTKLSPEVIRRACWIPISRDGRIDGKAVQPFLDWALEQRYLDGPIPMSKWWNPAFVDAAAAPEKK